MINDETFYVVNKFQVFVTSLIFWFAGAVMLSWVILLGKLCSWVFGP